MQGAGPLVSLVRDVTGKKTPGGAGTHATGEKTQGGAGTHTGYTSAHADTGSHRRTSQPSKPNDTPARPRDGRNRGRLNRRDR